MRPRVLISAPPPKSVLAGGILKGAELLATPVHVVGGAPTSTRGGAYAPLLTPWLRIFLNRSSYRSTLKIRAILYFDPAQVFALPL